VKRMNQFFVPQNLPQNKSDFDITLRLGVPEFSFITVGSKDVVDTFMAVKSDASGLDGIRKMLLPMVLPAGDAFF
jgi:hypothetical protein